jgi:hypothetical protein
LRLLGVRVGALSSAHEQPVPLTDEVGQSLSLFD